MQSNNAVSRRLYNILRELHDVLSAEYGPDFAYQFIGAGGTLAACSAGTGCVTPRLRPEGPTDHKTPSTN
jgi:hypothetical protein